MQTIKLIRHGLPKVICLDLRKAYHGLFRGTSIQDIGGVAVFPKTPSQDDVVVILENLKRLLQGKDPPCKSVLLTGKAPVWVSAAITAFLTEHGWHLEGEGIPGERLILWKPGLSDGHTESTIIS